jgi:hypothetical protein
MIGNPMRGSLGFPTSGIPAELLKALPPSLLPSQRCPRVEHVFDHPERAITIPCNLM